MPKVGACTRTKSPATKEPAMPNPIPSTPGHRPLTIACSYHARTHAPPSHVARRAQVDAILAAVCEASPAAADRLDALYVSNGEEGLATGIAQALPLLEEARAYLSKHSSPDVVLAFDNAINKLRRELTGRTASRNASATLGMPCWVTTDGETVVVSAQLDGDTLWQWIGSATVARLGPPPAGFEPEHAVIARAIQAAEDYLIRTGRR